jgi:hypothetical protein
MGQNMKHELHKEDAIEDPEGRLEMALIDEFLQSRGLDAQALRALLAPDLKRVMTEAAAYASARLAEVQSRAHYIHEIHRKE